MNNQSQLFPDPAEAFAKRTEPRLWVKELAVYKDFKPDKEMRRITLRPGMVPADHPQIKVFTSVTAFQGYVAEFRARGVVVSFTTPFIANCQDGS